MEKQKQEKHWVCPELVVIVRSQPEEAVLDFCKKGGSGASGPFFQVQDCAKKENSCNGPCGKPGKS